ncbi:cysteine synthase A [Sandaracinus amylolyticus]|uniref:cysteine synthase A n=1 Tax=Sandaracinus amylolyticus TaxID=927083 RepID=UPI001F02423C|nr:cysteine synthase A [Sandaracinus amylolyticus]UJR80592.1 Cysteine synthase A, O-acetylserine sulfhydrolase A subunit [Sandaracinus amylolyticus]
MERRGAREVAPVVDSVLDLIGETPMVRLRRITRGGNVWAKCEHLNPGGSVKDRICLAMIERAEREGRLRPGDTVVEPTSGNTGIGLALVCATKGYRLVLTMPASMSLERRQLLKSYGAQIVLTEPERVMEGAIAEAERIAAERGAFMPSQFDNPANPAIHEHSTADEILRAMGDEPVDALVAAVGTGGTVSGVGRVLKQRWPDVRVIAVEPEASPVLRGGVAGPSKIQGIGAGFVPGNFDGSVVDEIRGVEDRVAWDTKLRLAREEGLLVGISAGANVAVAIDVAEELRGVVRDREPNVITILCDTGERYFSLEAHFAE